MADFSLELEAGGVVCGIDEVGRGPLVGPVVAASVIIPLDVIGMDFWAEVNDSKKVSAKKREKLYPLICEYCPFGMGSASADEIDDINILQASLLAMSRAYDDMGKECDLALVDGNKAPSLPCNVRTVVKGDSVSLSIAAASIVAKVYRDRLLVEMDGEFPEYGWAQNAGYGTKAHMAALLSHGVSPHHRKTFAPVRRLLGV